MSAEQEPHDKIAKAIADGEPIAERIDGHGQRRDARIARGPVSQTVVEHAQLSALTQHGDRVAVITDVQAQGRSRQRLGRAGVAIPIIK